MKNDGKMWTELEENLGHSFKDRKLLKVALTHSSYINESLRSSTECYEILEFLGDAVIDLITRHLLMERFPELDEGGLSKIKSRVVGEMSLSRIARSLRVGDHLLLGKGEEKSGGREKESILSGAYEAVVAAIYLDANFDTAFKVVKGQILDAIERVNAKGFFRDYKTELQEFTQKHFKTPPTYRLIKEGGPEHERVFEIEVLIEGELYGKGRGKSKKDAEQKAASQAFKHLSKNTLSVPKENP